MKITALAYQQKNPQRVNVFVEGTYMFSLSVNEVLSLRLKKGNDVSELDIQSYKKLSADGKVRAATHEWLLNRPRSLQELKEYFIRKKVDETLQSQLTAYFLEKGILQNEVYARWEVERLARRNYSTRQIIAKLRQKGIEESTIAAVLGKDSAGRDLSALNETIKKVRSRTRYQDPKKLTAYLLSKGFTYEDIKTAMHSQEVE